MIVEPRRSPSFLWRLPIIVCGVILSISGIALWWRLGPSSRSLLFWLCMTAMPLGVLLAVTGLFLSNGFLLRALRLLTGNALVLAFLLGIAEAGFRGVRFDFETKTGLKNDSRDAYPICFRQPEKPFGEVFFQRLGPQQWTGKPLSTLLHLRHGTDHAYEDEKEFTASYDADGFRNPAGLKDWDVVVTGDSYTELGFLPVENIPTSVLASSSGLRVKNLGVCKTGSITQVHYLEHYGRAPSCKHAVIAFYEGNDILDAEEELGALKNYRATGKRPLRDRVPQTSILIAAYRLARDRVHLRQEHSYQDAWFIASGKEIPITIHPGPLPLPPDQMPASQRAALLTALDDWVAATRALGVKPWLMYLPLNNRVYDGLVRFTPQASGEVRRWKSHDLPLLVEKLCAERGIAFINTIPNLRSAAEQGILVYNPILDTHLNAEGASIVGRVLSEAFAKAAQN